MDLLGLNLCICLLYNEYHNSQGLSPTRQMKEVWVLTFCSHCYCCSVAHSCPSLCDSMDYSTPGLPVPHHLLKFAQIHVHCISDVIKSSHLLMPSSSALNFSQHQGLFQWVSCLHQMTKILELQLQHSSFQSKFQGWSPIRLTGLMSLLSKGLSGVFSSATVQRYQFFGVLPFYSPVLKIVHNHWEDHSFDYTGFFWQSNVSAFQYTLGLSSLSHQETIKSYFMPVVTICNDFGAQEEKICHYFYLIPFYLPCSNGARCHDLHFF